MGVSSGIGIGALLVVGLFLGTILIGAGIAIGSGVDGTDKRNNTGKLQDSDSASDLLSERGGSRSGNNRCHTSPEEIVLVLKFLLHTYRHNLSEHEKDCIEAAIEDYEKELKPRVTHTLEDKVLVINAFRANATDFEKCVLDEISDDLIELDAIKYVKEHEEAEDPLLCPMGYCPHAE